MKKSISIGRHTISEESQPFVIAEAGVNFYDIAATKNISPLEAAKLMIKEASRAKVDAIKFQTYKADKIASKFSPAYWDTSKESTDSQYKLFQKFDHFDEKEYQQLAAYAAEQNIIFLSTPFDLDAVDMLDPLVPAFKIASADITNIPLLKKVATKKKPVFFSTGASTLDEVKQAIDVMTQEGNTEVIPLHCTLSYPTAFEDANLRMITHLQEKFPRHFVGYSDHTTPDEGSLVLVAASVLGAKVIETHFTLDKTLPGNDHYHALDADDMVKLMERLKFVYQILGKAEKEVVESEQQSRLYARRSIVAVREIAEGTTITEDMLVMKRPGTGIPPTDLEKVIGKKAKHNIEEDKPLEWEDLH